MIPESNADWVKAFRKMGLSKELIGFAVSEPADPLFDLECQRHMLEQPFEHLPDVPGPPITPLWHDTTRVVGCRKQKKGLEFVEVQMEEVFNGGPEPVKVIAHGEQQLWAWIFRTNLEVSHDNPKKIDRLRESAKRVGFLHFEEALERVKGGGEYDEFILGLK